jgi:hypothetical protein
VIRRLQNQPHICRLTVHASLYKLALAHLNALVNCKSQGVAR